jgi:hypothetical protein
MKAASILAAVLAVATLSIAPATAKPRANAAVTSSPNENGPWVGCSWAAGWNLPAKPCRNLANYKSYNECTEGLAKGGATSLEKYWYCSSVRFKN